LPGSLVRILASSSSRIRRNVSASSRSPSWSINIPASVRYSGCRPSSHGGAHFVWAIRGTFSSKNRTGDRFLLLTVVHGIGLLRQSQTAPQSQQHFEENEYFILIGEHAVVGSAFRATAILCLESQLPLDGAENPFVLRGVSHKEGRQHAHALRVRSARPDAASLWSSRFFCKRLGPSIVFLPEARQILVSCEKLCRLFQFAFGCN
jgi:hypothetical protein